MALPPAAVNAAKSAYGTGTSDKHWNASGPGQSIVGTIMSAIVVMVTGTVAVQLLSS